MEIRTPVLALKGPRANRYTMGACVRSPQGCRADGFYHPRPGRSSNFEALSISPTVHHRAHRMVYIIHNFGGAPDIEMIVVAPSVVKDSNRPLA